MLILILLGYIDIIIWIESLNGRRSHTTDSTAIAHLQAYIPHFPPRSSPLIPDPPIAISHTHEQDRKIEGLPVTEGEDSGAVEHPVAGIDQNWDWLCLENELEVVASFDLSVAWDFEGLVLSAAGGYHARVRVLTVIAYAMIDYVFVSISW